MKTLLTYLIELIRDGIRLTPLLYFVWVVCLFLAPIIIVLGVIDAILSFVRWMMPPLPHRCAGDAIKAEQDGWIDKIEERITR